jgi:AraC-like DNA-binding protein
MKKKTAQPDSDVDERISRVTQYLRNTLREPPDYHRLAHLAHLSYSQLFRQFKRHVGVSPQQYVERQRLDYAKSLLTLNHLSVKEVAAQAGYPNQLYFSRRFQKATGRSPSQYRTDRLADPERPLHPYSYEPGTYITPHTSGSFA